MNVCFVQPNQSATSETFLDAQATRLDAEVTVVYRAKAGGPVCADGRPVLSPRLPSRMWRKLTRLSRGRNWQWERTAAYLKAFEHADVVLAQYGVTGVRVMDACRLAGKPLVVHFHGYDASRVDVIAKHRESYRKMFAQAAAIVVVSRAMMRAIIQLGCPAEKIAVIPCGAVLHEEQPVDAGNNPPTLLLVGRFVEKKAPHLALAAFAGALENCPDARLRLIGDGPLLDSCKDLADGLGIAHAVEFLGAQPHRVVLAQMRSARAFVQHSIVACNGDSEGTPVAVLEAGASGLPVIATRHAGIPDVAVDGQTALLVDEKDVRGMSHAMQTLIEDPARASRLGANGAARVREHFTVEKSVGRLSEVLAAVESRRPLEKRFREPEWIATPDGSEHEYAVEAVAERSS